MVVVNCGTISGLPEEWQLTGRYDQEILLGLLEAMQETRGCSQASFADMTSLHQAKGYDLGAFILHARLHPSEH